MTRRMLYTNGGMPGIILLKYLNRGVRSKYSKKPDNQKIIAAREKEHENRLIKKYGTQGILRQLAETGIIDDSGAIVSNLISKNYDVKNDSIETRAENRIGKKKAEAADFEK